MQHESTVSSLTETVASPVCFTKMRFVEAFRDGPGTANVFDALLT